MLNSFVALKPVTDVLLQLLATVILAVGSWAVGRFLTWLGIKNAQQLSANMDDALGKAVTYGLQKSQDLIRDKGWDHFDVRDNSLNEAATYMIAHFPDTLKASGVDLSDTTKTAAFVREALDRAFPAAALVASASPSTPPSTAPNPRLTADTAPIIGGVVTAAR